MRAVQGPPEAFAGVSPPPFRQPAPTAAYGAAAEDLPPSGHVDPGEYLDLQPVSALRHGHDDDDFSLG